MEVNIMRKARNVISLLLTASMLCMTAACSSGNSEKETSGTATEATTTTAEATTTEGTTTTTSATTTTEPTKPKCALEITNSNTLLKEKKNKSELSYFAYVEIKNTGTTYLSIEDTLFEFEDDDGMFIMEAGNVRTEVPSILGPDETGYVYATGTIDKASTSNGIHLVADIKGSELINPYAHFMEFPVSEVKVKTDKDNITVTGRITNDTVTDYDMPYSAVTAILFNSNNECIGALREYVMVSANTAKGFKLDAKSFDSFVYGSPKDVDHVVIPERMATSAWVLDHETGDSVHVKLN